MTQLSNNKLAGCSLVRLLNAVREAEDKAERADNLSDHSFYRALTLALKELQERRSAAEAQEPDYELHRDANRYRFLRDKDAFGDEDATDLASWSDLAELDAGEFDSAVDARLLNCEIPQYILTEAQERTATAGVYAELYRLRAELKGPDGFDTWKDAAIAERKNRVELEKQAQRVGDIDYFGAMSAFHSDEWHKMGPITGYMQGWNACRAAMLQPSSGALQLPDAIAENRLNSGPDADDYYVGYQSGWNECLEALCKAPAIPEFTAQAVDADTTSTQFESLSSQDKPRCICIECGAAVPNPEKPHR